MTRPLRSPLRIYANIADQHRTRCEDCDSPWHRVFVWRWMHWCKAERSYIYTDGFITAGTLAELDPPRLQIIETEAEASAA